MAARIYVIAGELSGDAHGAGLLAALKALRPELEIAGVGGPEMAAVAGGGVRDWVEDAAVVGLWEVAKHYQWFRQRFDQMLAEVKARRPDVLLLIDYPGFNLRFARALRRECPQTRQVYYISPQVWAWNRRRIPQMARLLDQMLCLFPFEQALFETAGLRTTCVGHPLVDELQVQRINGVVRDARLVGLFPGSREREVARLFPVMLETAKYLLAGDADLRFEAPAASPKLAVQMHALAGQAQLGGQLNITTGASHSLMQRACCGVIASGTATLEAAYFGLPYCLTYKVAWPTYLVGRMLVRLKHIGLVNILAGEEVVEEFIQADAEAQPIGTALRRLLQDADYRGALQARLAQTAAKLGPAGTHQRAARAVAAWLPPA
ncbi:MAG: lipid-A-disaccharide synthase [Verrucomicrobia bacterium]|nr:MAG: lipid-A-disaccharide synthase [Verrucomicrobiota bacterium]